MSIAHVITVSFPLVKSGITIVYIRKNSNPLGKNLNLPTIYDCVTSLTSEW